MVSCVHVQEPGPAKVAVTGSGIPEAEKVPDSSSIIWQEELNQREAEGAAVWAPDLPPGSPLPLAGKEEYHLCIEELCVVVHEIEKRGTNVVNVPEV